MHPLESIFLGILQGLTEFIPVSSSGHLEVIPTVFGMSEPSTIFILFAHLGTLLALVVHFRHKILRLIFAFFSFFKRTENKGYKDDRRLLVNMIIASVPAGVLGLLVKEVIDNMYTSTDSSNMAIFLTLGAMALLGVVFILSPRFLTSKKYDLNKLTTRNAFLIGITQALAFIRGTSRSGITLITGQLMGLDRVSSAEFSFFISIPVIAATSLYGIYELISLPSEQINSELVPALLALVTAFVSGLLAIRFLLGYLKKHGLAVFGWYRIIFAVIIALIFVL